MNRCQVSGVRCKKRRVTALELWSLAPGPGTRHLEPDTYDSSPRHREIIPASRRPALRAAPDLARRRGGKPDDREAAVTDTLDPFGMVAKKNLYPRQLSGGQQQLVAVARAVIHRPALLLADEPTGNLHSSQGKDIMQLFRELNAAGTTIVQVTHSEENAKYGSRVVQLRDGWIVS